MTRKEKADRIGIILDELYQEWPIPLDHKDSYTLLIAVLLSAQCTDKRVNTVTPELFALADNAFDMAVQDQAEVQRIIRPCGLSPQKSKAIIGLSKILVDKYQGEVPADMEILETLPGVGHKTASVVMVQAFGVPAFPVDTHIHRLAYRWMLSNGKSVAQTEKDLKKVFPKEEWNRRHLQIIYFGREYCPARGHRRENCPICKQYGRKSMD
ncbi:endonuclease III domain-containing protein [Membranihabitans marinus]|uniref:endonuclease III domain-containing protein n=1 Tax=Membranihabitans marinus TaxID=1227546 RepID=UPI001F469ECE|nr:endonuclease III [Membranihabitans marinus]